jgi:hypothetical protein
MYLLYVHFIAPQQILFSPRNVTTPCAKTFGVITIKGWFLLEKHTNQALHRYMDTGQIDKQTNL